MAVYEVWCNQIIFHGIYERFFFAWLAWNSRQVSWDSKRFHEDILRIGEMVWSDWILWDFISWRFIEIWSGFNDLRLDFIPAIMGRYKHWYFIINCKDSIRLGFNWIVLGIQFSQYGHTSGTRYVMIQYVGVYMRRGYNNKSNGWSYFD